MYPSTTRIPQLPFITNKHHTFYLVEHGLLVSPLAAVFSFYAASDYLWSEMASALAKKRFEWKIMVLIMVIIKFYARGPHINFMRSGVTYFYDSGWTRCRAALLTYPRFFSFLNQPMSAYISKCINTFFLEWRGTFSNRMRLVRNSIE